MKKINKALALMLVLVLAVSVMAGCKKTTDDNKGGTTTVTDAPKKDDKGSNTTEPTKAADNTDAEPVAPKDYTYHTYATSLADKWNPHTWETNADDAMLSYFVTRWVDTTVADTEEGEYQIIFEAATSIEDVTAAHQDDLTKYGSTLPEGKTAADITEGYVYEIKLNPDLAWENGNKITADDYIYSMEQLLNPEMLNYRSNTYWDGEYALAGAKKYYYSKTEGYYVPYVNLFGSLDDAVAAGDVFVDCWGFWGAEGYVDANGNAVPQYVNITDETKYSADGQGNDEFSGADLYASYGAYFQIGGGYEKYVAVWQLNADLGAGYDVVGFYKVDDYTVRYVCVTSTNYKEILVQHFGSPFLVNKEFYEANKDTTGDLVTSSYATSKETTISFGPYRLESFQEGKQYVIVRNENWYGWEDDGNGGLVSYTPFEVDGEHVEQYQTTKIVCDVMTDDAAKQAFLKGELDSWVPTSAELSTYSLSDKMYKQPESYTMRLFFNTNVDALKEMDNSKGNENSIVMSNENFTR